MSWAAFDEETQRQRQVWEHRLHLWRLEVVSTRCSWELWPSDSTRNCYKLALAERELCEATLAALPRRCGTSGEPA